MTVEIGRKKENILGIDVDSTSIPQVLRRIRAKLANFDRARLGFNQLKAKNNGFLIVTPNPEQVMRAQEDSVFAKILNSADISVPDGIGLIAAHKFLILPKTKNLILKPFLYFAQGLGVGFSVVFDRKWLTKEINVIRGRKLFMEIIRLANKKRWRVFLLGDKLKSAKKAADELRKSYKSIKLDACEGPDLDEDANPVNPEDKEIERKAMDVINKVNPQVLFVGFGAPKQEKWVYRHINEINVGGTMVVGGTFDYVSGKKPLPPKWAEDMGLEWFWRLMKKDQKVKRIINAFPKFAWRVFEEKLLR